MTPDIKAPSNEDIIRTCITLLRARQDEDQVGELINSELSAHHPGLHTSILKVLLRVVVAQFYGPVARRLDHEIGWEFCQAGLDLEEAATNGTLEPDEDDGPHLMVVGTT